MTADTAGPVIVWESYGAEGWQPTSYPDLTAALTAARYNTEFVVTHRAQFKVIDLTPPPPAQFECAYCVSRDVQVSGKHSHVCSRCGTFAVGGWYTTPWCEGCKEAVLAASP